MPEDGQGEKIMEKEFKVGETYYEVNCSGCGYDLAEWREDYVIVKKAGKSIWIAPHKDLPAKRYTLHIDDDGSEYATNKGKYIFRKYCKVLSE